MNSLGSISHDHVCIACATEWRCKDNQCSFSDDLREGIRHENPIGTTCQKCRDSKVRKQSEKSKSNGESKTEPLPTRPSDAAMDDAGELIKHIDSIICYQFGNKQSIDEMDPQEWVNQFHKYRIAYEHLHRIGDMLHERKIIARLKSERKYHHTKKTKDKDLERKSAQPKQRGLSKEEKQVRNLIALGLSEIDARKQVAAILMKAKGV